MQEIITLRLAWRDYQRIGRAKEQTLKDYADRLERVKDWMDLDMNDITKNMVEERHRELSHTAPIMANYTFRVIRTLYNFAMSRYEHENESIVRRNPVKRLSEVRGWNKERPRRRHVPLHKMCSWFDGVLMLDTPTMRDYLILCLLTGFRKDEAATLKWTQIDFDGGFIHLEKTKNGEAHTLPTSTFLYNLLKERHEFHKTNDYVFPGKTTDHMTSPYKAIEKVTISTGIRFSPHDLRRTFNLLGEEAGVDEFNRKRLLNHTFAEVTHRHYSVPNPERLREPMQKITNHALKLANLL